MTLLLLLLLTAMPLSIALTCLKDVNNNMSASDVNKVSVLTASNNLQQDVQLVSSCARDTDWSGKNIQRELKDWILSINVVRTVFRYKIILT